MGIEMKPINHYVKNVKGEPTDLPKRCTQPTEMQSFFQRIRAFVFKGQCSFQMILLMHYKNGTLLCDKKLQETVEYLVSS